MSPLIKTEITFGHLLKQGEDGTLLDERLGLEEVHRRGERRPRHLPPFHPTESGVHLRLRGRQGHRAADLPRGLQADEGVPLGGVGGRTAHRPPAEENQDPPVGEASSSSH